MPETILIPRYVECGCGCNRMSEEEWESAMLEAESNNFE